MASRRRNHEAPQTVAELVQYHCAYLDRLVNRGELSKYTADHYIRFTRRFKIEFGAVLVHEIAQPHLERVLDIWSRTDNAYNNALRAIKHLFQYGEKHWQLSCNPAKDLGKKPVSTDGFLAWEPEHLRAYFEVHKLGTKAYLAMMLLMYAAPRLSDLVNLGPENLTDLDGEKYLVFKPQKTKNVTVSIPVDLKLQEAIDAVHNGEETFLCTKSGQKHSAKAFGNYIAGWRQEAGINDPVSAHGMRKTVGINMAENGATEYELMAALGHTTPKVTEVYTRAARRRLLAAQASSKSTLSSLVIGEDT